MSDAAIPKVIWVMYELDGTVADVVTNPDEVLELDRGMMGWKGTWEGVRYEHNSLD